MDREVQVISFVGEASSSTQSIIIGELHEREKFGPWSCSRYGDIVQVFDWYILSGHPLLDDIWRKNASTYLKLFLGIGRSGKQTWSPCQR